MTISKKLLLTLSLALFALLAVGGYSLWQQGRAQSQHEAMMSNIFPSLDDINTEQHALSNIRVGLRAMLQAEGEVESREALERVTTAKKRFDAAVADYQDKNVYNEQDQQTLNAVREAMARYWAAAQPLMTQAGSLEHARQVALIKEAGRYATQTEKALDAHYLLNKQLTDEDAANSRTAYETTRNWSLLCIGLVFALTSLLSLQLYRTIRGGLEQIRDDLRNVSSTLDFTWRTKVQRHDEVGEASEALNQLLDKLQTSFQALHGIAKEVDTASHGLSATAQQVSTASAVQSESASSMAATVEQMTVSINHVAEQAKATQQGAVAAQDLVASGSEIIRNTIDDIHQISSVVKASVTQIQHLESKSAQVGSVVNVIREIADQTNLLALNAAIEAARAGEQGRGFAVVADEVRKLAERTSNSTQEIAVTIDSMLSVAKETVARMETADQLVETGVARADEASRAIGEIGENAAKAASSISEISAAIQQQGVASNNIAMQVEQTAQMSEESNAAAKNTAENAGYLDGLVKRQMGTLGQFRV